MAPYGSPWPNIFLKLSQLKNVRVSLLSIEHELLRDLDTKGIISKFAAQKARRRVML